MIDQSEMQSAERMIRSALERGAGHAMEAIPREYATAPEVERAAIVAVLTGRVCVAEAMRRLRA
jgi:hypothetical protein